MVERLEGFVRAWIRSCAERFELGRSLRKFESTEETLRRLSSEAGALHMRLQPYGSKTGAKGLAGGAPPVE